MHSFVYASQRKPDTYVWLTRREGFDVLPEPLVLLLGELRLVLEVELTPERRLPHEDSERVLANLASQGWHMQTPPTKRSASATSRTTIARSIRTSSSSEPDKAPSVHGQDVQSGLTRRYRVGGFRSAYSCAWPIPNVVARR